MVQKEVEDEGHKDQMRGDIAACKYLTVRRGGPEANEDCRIGGVACELVGMLVWRGEREVCANI